MCKTAAIKRERLESVEGKDRIAAAEVDAMARRVVELLGDRHVVVPAAGPDLVDAAELARRLGTRRSWIYEHAMELGAIRLGAGRRPRLRFDAGFALDRLQAIHTTGEGAPTAARRRRMDRNRRDVRLLPIKRGVAS